MRIAITLAIVPLAFLAGCQSEAQQLQEARTDALAKCNDDPRIKANMASLDSGRFCTCLTNKLFEGRSAAEIARLGEEANKAEAQQKSLEWSAQCVGEQMRGETGAAPAAGAPAPAAGAPPAAVPAETQNAAAETIEEGADEAE